MNKFVERLRHTLNPQDDVAAPSRGIAIPEGEAEDLLVAALIRSEKGLWGILNELEAECRQYLRDRGVVMRPLNPEHPGYTSFLMEDMLPAARKDQETNEICSLLFDIVGARLEYLKIPADSLREQSNLGFRMFQLGATAEGAKLATARKYAATGIKVRAGVDKANLIKSELADEAHDIVKARFQHFLDDGIKSRNLPTQYIKRFGGDYSKRHLRRIRDEM